MSAAWANGLLYVEGLDQSKWHALKGAGAEADLDARRTGILDLSRRHDILLEVFPVPPRRSIVMIYRLRY
jgi:hypothetical protein